MVRDRQSGRCRQVVVGTKNIEVEDVAELKLGFSETQFQHGPSMSALKMK